MLNSSTPDDQVESIEINPSSSDSKQKAIAIQELAIPKPLPPCPVHGTHNVKQIKANKYYCNPYKHNFFVP